METPKALRDAPRAVEKLEFLEDEAAAARAIENSIDDDANQSRGWLRADITAAGQTKTREDLDKAVAEANRQHAIRQARCDRRRADNAARTNDGFTASRMRMALIDEDEGVVFADARLYAPTTAEMAKPAVEVDRLRKAVEKLAVERRRVWLAPRTKAELHAAARKTIEDIAAQHEPRPKLTRNSVDGRGNPDPLSLTDTLRDEKAAGFLVWAFRDELIRRTAGLFDGIDLSGALSDADRNAELNRLDRQILALERQEEAIIVLARENGTFIPRRDDASLLAVLGIERAR